MSPSDSFHAEYESLAKGSGFVALENWSTVVLTGADSQAFLHNMCTNDIKRMRPGDRCEAYCTDVKGKIVGQIFVFAHAERLELLTLPLQAETLIGHLDRFIIREDVAMSDETATAKWFFLSGDQAASIVSRFARDTEGKPFSTAIWETVRIELGLPLFGVDFDNTNLPQEVNRDAQSIHFNKGCYLGQETIARIDALGHVNQKVVSLKFTGEALPPIGMEVTDKGKTVGRVTSHCWSPRFAAPLALAMVRRGSNAVGSELDSECGAATVIETG